jgi:hypothetical protein
MFDGVESRFKPIRPATVFFIAKGETTYLGGFEDEADRRACGGSYYNPPITDDFG